MTGFNWNHDPWQVNLQSKVHKIPEKVHNTIWLGTTNGIILTIRDFIKPERPYALEDSFRPFHGPIIQLKASYFQKLNPKIQNSDLEVSQQRRRERDGDRQALRAAPQPNRPHQRRLSLR